MVKKTRKRPNVAVVDLLSTCCSILGAHEPGNRACRWTDSGLSVWITSGLTTVMKVDKTKAHKIGRAILRPISGWSWQETVGGGRRWFAYIIIVCASLSLSCQRHTTLLPPSTIAPNARASVVLSSFYLSASYDCFWQRPVPVSPATSSATPSSWNRGRIRRRERWWGCLCFFATYHCRSGTTAYFSVALFLCSSYIPRTYFRPMGPSIPSISCCCSSPSTRYPTSTATSA